MSRSGVRMAEELPGFIPWVVQRGDVSLLRADEAVLKVAPSRTPRRPDSGERNERQSRTTRQRRTRGALRRHPGNSSIRHCDDIPVMRCCCYRRRYSRLCGADSITMTW